MRRLQKRVLTLIGHLQFRVTFTDAVAARRIVRQAPRDLFPRASYQNQNIHIPWPKPKRPLRKLSLRKPLPRSRPPRRPSPRRRSNEPLSLLFFGQEPPDFRAALLFCGFGESRCGAGFAPHALRSRRALGFRPTPHRLRLISLRSRVRVRVAGQPTAAGVAESNAPPRFRHAGPSNRRRS